MVTLEVMDAVDQLDSVASTSTNTTTTSQHHDADFDTFKAVAQSIVESTVTTTSTTPSVSQQLKESVTSTSDTFLTPNSSEHDDKDDPPVTTGVRRFVSPKDFEFLKVIGMGAFGKVLQVRNKSSKQVLAMKVISKRLLRRKGDGVIENVLAERNILRRVRHPFVVAMHCSFQSREKLFIIMDFLAGGELFLRLGREGIFLEKTVGDSIYCIFSCWR
jgi:Protein kinase domain